MAKNKNSIKKLNLIKVVTHLNFISFNLVFLLSIILAFTFLLGYSQINNKNIDLMKEKKEKIFEQYLNELFQRILLLSYSTPFLNYLHAGNISRKILEPELLQNFNPYISKEIIGYKLLDIKHNEIISVGDQSNVYFILEICYLNETLNPKLGRCKANIFVYLNMERVINKIKILDPSISTCFHCQYFKIKDGSIINGFKVIKNNNFTIPFSINNDKYMQNFFFILILLTIMSVIIIFSFYANRKMLNKNVITPITNLFNYVNDELTRGPFILDEISHIADKIDELKNRIQNSEREKQQAEFTKLAQVAHDIKSPLSALNVFLVKTAELQEDKRIMARNAIQRIHDIVNNLIQKQQIIFKKGDIVANIPENLEPSSIQLLSSLIEPLISEMRMQYRDKLTVNIELNLSEASYGLFSRIQPNEFKRLISNLINNAVEAIEKEGLVSLHIDTILEDIQITIIDNGKGISPEILPKLTKQGATFGKIGGTGLGLSHAKTVAEYWGGRLEIHSKVGVGTKIILFLPKVQEPNWFVPKLFLKRYSTIVIIDDDTSIHNIWNEKFKNIIKIEHNINLLHFSNPTDIISWFNDNKGLIGQDIYYLCDFEFINYHMNGLELISLLNIQKQSIIVTSRYEEAGFQETCEKIGVKLIPKGLVYFIPIKIHIAQIFDAILIDDDPIIHSIWKLTAKGKNIICFENPTSFLNEMEQFDFNTPIYIDSQLGEGKKGEEIAKRIFNKGFKEIFLATGYPQDYFPAMEWIKGIVGKNPPWME
jgi:signal transduction histidine kinase